MIFNTSFEGLQYLCQLIVETECWIFRFSSRKRFTLNMLLKYFCYYTLVKDFFGFVQHILENDNMTLISLSHFLFNTFPFLSQHWWKPALPNTFFWVIHSFIWHRFEKFTCKSYNYFLICTDQALLLTVLPFYLFNFST